MIPRATCSSCAQQFVDGTTARRGCGAAARGHVPGDNPVSGRHRGYDEVFTGIGERMQPLDRWAIDVGEVMGNDDMVVPVVDVIAVRGEHRVACRGSHLFRLTGCGS
jgi:hypothetical protein